MQLGRFGLSDTLYTLIILKTMPRFYLTDSLASGQILDLPDNIVRHLNVLRLKHEEEIVLFNGNGHAYPARLLDLEKRRARAEVLREEHTDNESPLNITDRKSVV